MTAHLNTSCCPKLLSSARLTACVTANHADEDQSPWVWMLRLKLADATGQLDALLFSEDGTHFLQASTSADDSNVNP